MSRSKTSKDTSAGADAQATESAQTTAAAGTDEALVARVAQLEELVAQTRDLATVALSELNDRVEAIEAKLDAAKGAVVELTDAEAPFVTRDELEGEYLGPLLDRIRQLRGPGLSHHQDLPPATPEAIEVRVADDRKRHPRAGITFTRSWLRLRTANLNASQFDAITEDPLLEVREAEEGG